jgi:hypothetical protein
LPAFNTRTGIPHSTVNLKTYEHSLFGHATITITDRRCRGKAWSPSWSAGNAFLAEFGSLHLEFEALAHHLNDASYYDKVERINDVMLAADTSAHGGLFPSQYHPETGRFSNGNEIIYEISFLHIYRAPYLIEKPHYLEIPTYVPNLDFELGLHILIWKPSRILYVLFAKKGK